MQSEVMVLIGRTLAGDQSAFAALYHQYKNLVYKTAWLLLGNTAEADDALQEVFLLAHRALATYQPERAAFSTWLYRITTNYCLSWRRRRRLNLLPLEWAGGTADAAQRQHEERLEDTDTVFRCVQRLSGKKRAVVVLRYYWDLSYAEISTILDIPLGTVKSRLNEALRVMRDELGPLLSLENATLPDTGREVRS